MRASSVPGLPARPVPVLCAALVLSALPWRVPSPADAQTVVAPGPAGKGTDDLEKALRRARPGVVKDVWWDPLSFDKVPDGNPAPTGCAARNNVFYKGKKGGGIAIANPGAWTFSNNCWPDGIPALAKDPSSFQADPRFLKPEANAPEGFKLLAQSPCLGRAAPLKEVASDFWGTPRRKQTPCVGLHEPK